MSSNALLLGRLAERPSKVYSNSTIGLLMG
jgi:hypothetical protein